MDGADFPEMFKPLTSNMAKALDELHTRTDVKWTYVSPAGDFRADGAKTGKYILGGEGRRCGGIVDRRQRSLMEI